MLRRAAIVVAIALIAILGWRLLSIWLTPPPATSTTAPAPGGAVPTAPERKITATLYYVSDDGMSLVGVPQEVPYGEAVIDQARLIVTAQIAAAVPPLVSAVPEGTALRALYFTERGDAFVDLSADVRTGHTGGTLDELFTVYTIVNALTTNLPAVTRVQILIDGKEVDTLAGHVDLRHPLSKNLRWVKTEKSEL